MAEEQVFREAAGLTDDEDVGWTRLTANPQRDLAPLKQDRMIAIAVYLYDQNPLAKWMLEITRDFLMAEGVTVAADDATVQEVLDAHWRDPLNLWDLKGPGKILELGLFGEQLWPVFTNASSGLVRLAVVDPARIRAVEHDPDNAEAPIGVVLRGRAGHPGKKLRVIYPLADDELFAPPAARRRAEYFTDGEAFWWTANKVSTATRGRSDLLALGDWLDGYEQFLFNTMDRVGYLNAFVWDVMLQGADEGVIRAWQAQNPPPKPGTVFAHNENIIMQAVTPNLQGADTSDMARLFRNQILGGMGLPSHWYGGGEDANLATSQAMGVPTFRRFQFRQRLVRYMLTYVLDYQLRMAQKHGGLSPRADLTYSVTLPQLQPEDVIRMAAALQQLTTATAVAEQQGWIEAGTAQRLFAAMASRFGVDVPVDELAARAEARVTPEYRRRANGTATHRGRT